MDQSRVQRKAKVRKPESGPVGGAARWLAVGALRRGTAAVRHIAFLTKRTHLWVDFTWVMQKNEPILNPCSPSSVAGLLRRVDEFRAPGFGLGMMKARGGRLRER